MKKFLNILLLLGALGLVVACSPAGRNNAKLKRHKQKEQPVGPWDGDPEEILAEEGYFWWGGVSLNTCGYIGFKKHNGTLYAYVEHRFIPDDDYPARHYVYPKHMEDFWPQAYENFDLDAKDRYGYTRWHKVQWQDKAKGIFAIPTLDLDVIYRLDTENKSLQRNYIDYDAEVYDVNLKKWSTALTTDYTDQ